MIELKKKNIMHLTKKEKLQIPPQWLLDKFMKDNNKGGDCNDNNKGGDSNDNDKGYDADNSSESISSYNDSESY